MKRPITIFDPSRVFSDSFMDTFFGGAGLNFQYTNDLEMYEENDNVIVKLKIPGFEEDQINITIEDRTLTIGGNVKQENEEEEKNKKYYYKEMRQESFTRSVMLPIRVDGDKAVAEIKDGIITVTMPKAEDAKPKSVSVKKVGK
jgi:HSP20 family protein